VISGAADVDQLRPVVNAGAGRGRSRPELRLACGKIVDGESHIVAVEIDLDHPVDRFAEDGELVERGFEEPLLQDSVDRRDQNDEPGMQRLRGVKAPKVARIIGDQDEIAVTRVSCDIPVLPAGFANAGNVMSFMAGPPGDGN
jgi:hypothetical protein